MEPVWLAQLQRVDQQVQVGCSGGCGADGDTVTGAPALVLFPVCWVSVAIVEVCVLSGRPRCREELSRSPQ